MRTSNIVIQNGREVAPLPRVGRKLRKPSYNFNLVTRPYGIYPFMIAPVLAGETMKSALMQSRVVTDPIRERLLGWWKEYYWFYVKLSDMDDRDTLTQMLINPGTSTLAIDSETAVPVMNFFAATGAPYIDYLSKGYDRIIKEYFRDEQETAAPTVETGISQAMYTAPGLWRSIENAASTDLDYKDVSISTAGDNAFTIEEMERAYDQYEILRMGGFVSMSYDDYIAAQGVRVPEEEREEQRRPELLRFARSWQYPVSAIDPLTGNAASAVQWSIAERIDKDRFFKEPGFVIGVTVTRPKVYLNVKGYAAQLLDTAYSWLPRVLDDDPTNSLRVLPPTTGLGGTVWTDAGGVYVDLKDMFLYGDQFFNMGAGSVPNPVSAATSGVLRYATSANIDNFFSAATPTNLNARVREDGVCTLNILTRPMVATDTSRGVMSSQEM